MRLCKSRRLTLTEWGTTAEPWDVAARLGKLGSHHHGDGRDAKYSATLAFALTRESAEKIWWERRAFLARYLRFDVIGPDFARLPVSDIREYMAQLRRILEAENPPPKLKGQAENHF